jgi:hypothetical protein
MVALAFQFGSVWLRQYGLYLLNLHGMYRAAGCSFRRNSQDRGALRREERLTPGNE